MCKSFYISICLSALLFSTAAFSAQEKTKKDQTAPKQKTQPAKKQVQDKTPPVKQQTQVKQKPVDKGVEKILGGHLTAVDAAKNTITVHVKSGDYPVSVDAATVLVAGNDKISFADLKTGNRVTVKYLRFRNGGRKALHVNNVTFQTARAAKSAEEKKKAAALAAKKQKQTPAKKEAPVAKKVEKQAPPAKVVKKPAPTTKQTKETARTKQPKPDQAHEE